MKAVMLRFGKRVEIRRATQADEVDLFFSDLVRQATPLFRAAITADARHEPGADDRWESLTSAIARAMVLAELTGRAIEARRARRAGAPTPPRVETFAIGTLARRVLGIPFLKAVSAFVGDVPNLERILGSAAQASKAKSASATSRLRNRTRALITEALEALEDEDGRLPAKPGATATVSTEAATRALGQALRTERIQGLLETETRTALVGALNAGARATTQEHADVFPLTILSEIRDRRTRGNPKGLYPDAGPHFQMDGFVAPTLDPVWQQITPPNGYNCRATIRGMTAGEARRKGWVREDGTIDHARLEADMAPKRRLIDQGLYPDPGF